jgi:hypothetical protein
MDHLNQNNELLKSGKLSDFFSSCVVGESIDGRKIYSFKKMVEKTIDENFTEHEAVEFLVRTSVFTFPSMEHSIIIMDW